MNQPNERGWVELVYDAPVDPTTVVYSQEYLDDVLFVTTSRYDSAGKLEYKTMTRADLVKG